MNDLREFSALQARVYEFLAEQDEATLQRIVDGTVRLAVRSDGDVQAPARHTVVPAKDPFQAAQDLARLASEHERQVYLNATGLTGKQLQKVARSLGLKRYSHLSKPKLVALLAGHGPDRTEAAAVEPKRPERPSPVAEPAGVVPENHDAAAVAARLRDIETEEEGAAYLRSQRLDRTGLLAVAAELQLTRVDRLKPSELEKRVLKQAIGARRKFAGLRNW
ncbi:hypothetical protein [Actinophytocola sp. KF-1]